MSSRVFAIFSDVSALAISAGPASVLLYIVRASLRSWEMLSNTSAASIPCFIMVVARSTTPFTAVAESELEMPCFMRSPLTSARCQSPTGTVPVCAMTAFGSAARPRTALIASMESGARISMSGSLAAILFHLGSLCVASVAAVSPTPACSTVKRLRVVGFVSDGSVAIPCLAASSCASSLGAFSRANPTSLPENTSPVSETNPFVGSRFGMVSVGLAR